MTILSIVVPAKNEAKNLVELVERLEDCLPDAEIVIVNNGSSDNSREVLAGLNCRVVDVKSSGKTYAVKKGIEASTGNAIALIDADLQYNPEDIAKLVQKMRDAEADFVNGWRNFSQYPRNKRIISVIYNWVYRLAFNVKIHDANCGLKLFKREVAQNLIYREGYHRYFVAIAKQAGYKIAEAPVPLNLRKEGKSSFGATRILDGFFDLISVKLSMTILRRPMSFFGSASLILVSAGFLYNFILEKTWIPNILIISGFIAFMFGLIAEMIMNLEKRWRLE